MIWIFLNPLKLVLCPIVWSVFENVPYAFEKNVYFASLGWNFLYISVKSIWSRLLFNAEILLLIFCLENISIVDNGVLKSPTISVLLLISFLKSCKIFFIYLGAPILGSYMFIMFMSSWWILSLSIMQYPSVSLFMAFVLKSVFFWYTYCYPRFFFLSICLEYFFPILHFHSV